MTLYSTIGFMAAMLILAISPGPGVFATVATSLASGFRNTITVIGGIVAGDIVFLLLAVFGLSVVATILGEFFFLVRICGGVYLIILGTKVFLAKPQLTSNDSGIASTHPFSGFVSGLVITLSNPKVILFYCGFLPTFLDLNKMKAIDLLIIISIVTLVLTGVMSTYALLASRARHLFKQPKSVRRLNRVAGSMMAVVGALLISRS